MVGRGCWDGLDGLDGRDGRYGRDNRDGLAGSHKIIANRGPRMNMLFSCLVDEQMFVDMARF